VSLLYSLRVFIRKRGRGKREEGKKRNGPRLRRGEKGVSHLSEGEKRKGEKKKHLS